MCNFIFFNDHLSGFLSQYLINVLIGVVKKKVENCSVKGNKNQSLNKAKDVLLQL